ncbi:MAG: [FeFe] hydrogenase H-cluster radical SAM maturase HydE [Prolixibacteraceae bacterium]|nr:[FeFe] hydrogenase H-cluster radical SAM maturase HydE [Prolixibacteraceae bacterium]MBT6007367.1 [FeFe] hydrogenase H-cluster radical SAM maturase HydE [Prolixibacteraceae bacterium]MBT6764630.1 [FeFe] hydrogenase H-cluster radical SAM maturase HydE [Prolixibacteraceae bacterium]MBT6998463.1 [FeFe] hydrogenase H-cluster radical SAM maturase HydE [Prolixibacteraceae bacterium]MBT7394390.1 [FeFe] hydrogenase H-cluster radical SAM maturase HydE [Prolixibacteraceae bacterium]
MKPIKEILEQNLFTKEEIIQLLQSKGEQRTLLLKKSQQVKNNVVGNKVYFRGLIEFSNICSKDCLYCGIRKSNTNVFRYNANDAEILDACNFAWKNRFASVVLQSGEISSPAFVKRVDNLLKKIKQLSNSELGITLSCGEQTRETYRRWFESGAHRFLLRIESSNPDLYYKVHPKNKKHSFEKRMEALQFLKETGYQVGTGVMVGLPFQEFEDLANDLLFFKEIDIDMCGTGPYIEHEDTPLYEYRNLLKTKQERFDLTLNMIAVLRLLMPDINIAAATALQAIDPAGREKALVVGANIIMPNLTPCDYRKEYQLYEDKPCLDEDAELCRNCLEARIELAGSEIGYDLWGDSKHFFNRKK